MAQQYQFGNRFSLGQKHKDKFEHYRLQITKLQQQNLQQQQAYSKKIASLQQIIKQQQQGNFNSASSSYSSTINMAGNEQVKYQSPTITHVQILKRDKQINRLSQQIQKLRKQVNVNPDHQLLIKKRGFFDQIADKDAEIIRLKRTIYQMQSKYDGKYFNDVRIKNQYAVLEQQNKKLRKQLQQLNSTSTKTDNLVQNQLLEGIKYKKQAELLAQENQMLKSQYRKSEQEYSKFVGNMQGKINAASQIEVLKRDLRQSNKRNQELIQYAKQLQMKNLTLQSQIRPIGAIQNMGQRNPQQIQHGSNMSSKIVSSGSKKKNRIFQQKQPQQSTIIQQRNINNTIYQTSTPESQKNDKQAEFRKQKQQQQLLHQRELQQQRERMREHQNFLEERQKRIQQQYQLQRNDKMYKQNSNVNNSQILAETARKKGGYYDRFGLNRITSRVSGVQLNTSK